MFNAKITMLRKCLCLKKDEVFSFHAGVNLLVGEQGSGKSTILKICMNPKFYAGVVMIECNDPISTRSFDFEKNNPRIGAKIETMEQIVSHFVSHGEANNAILDASIKEFKNMLLLMDEPDMALSIRSCYKLIDTFKKLVDNGCHIIAAVHNPIVIAGFPEVYSMEHRKVMSSGDFIKSHS